MDPHREQLLTHYITVCPKKSSIKADGIVTKVQIMKNSYNCYESNCLEVEQARLQCPGRWLSDVLFQS